MLLALLTVACGGSETPEPDGCTFQLDGECIGVQAQAICDGDFCGGGEVCGSPVDCQTVVQVSSDAALVAALLSPAPGTCVEVAPGSYSAVTLPSGVSLLGAGAASVTLAAVVMSTGSDTNLRGVTVASGAVVVQGTTTACIDAVRVQSSGNNGIELEVGSSLTLQASEVVDSANYGVLTEDASLSINQSVIAISTRSGLRAVCSSGCGCAQKPSIDVDRSLFHQVGEVGVVLAGVEADLFDVKIFETQQVDGNFGGGIAASDCSELLARSIQIDNIGSGYGNSYGILMESSTGHLGGSGEDEGIIIVGGRPGVWISDSQQVTEPTKGVTVENMHLQQSVGAGIGVSGGAKGIIIVGGSVASTASKSIPNFNGGSDTIGYGLVASDASQVIVSGVALSDSDTRSILFDGPAGVGSALTDLALSGGDEVSGVLQQGVMASDATLTVSSAGVPFVKDQQQPFSLPPAPTTPGTN